MSPILLSLTSGCLGIYFSVPFNNGDLRVRVNTEEEHLNTGT